MILDKIKNVFNRDGPDELKQYGLTKEKVISFVDERFEEAKQERVQFELKWQLNSSFLDGNQYVDIDPHQHRIVDVPIQSDSQQRFVFNQIAPIYETRLAKLGRIRPIPKTRPASSDFSDLSSSRISTAVLQSDYNRLTMLEKIKTATAWSEITGTVFYKTTWNPNSGELLGELEGEEGEKQEVFEGDTECEVVSPYEIYPDNPFVNNLNECRYLIRAKAMDAEIIESKWGVKVKGHDVDILGLTNKRVIGSLGFSMSFPQMVTTKKKNAEIVKELYQYPCKEFPKGRLIVIAGKEVLHYGELPYINGERSKREYPFRRQVCIETPGQIWGKSIIERLIPVQVAYNALKNRKIEYLNRCTIGVWKAEEGTIDFDDLEENGINPGDIITHQRGSRGLEEVKNGELPQAFYDEEAKLINEFIMISGVSEISRTSSTPSNVGSGVAIGILQEQDDTRLSLTAEHIRDAVLGVSKHLLRIKKQFASGMRMTKHIDSNDISMLVYWESSNLTTDDIIFENENELSQTPSQRRQLVIQLLQMGMFINPKTGSIDSRTQNKILEMLQIGNWEDSKDIISLQVAKAQKENIQISQGILPDLREFDDNELHIQEHDAFRLTMDYDVLRKKNPQLALLFDMHVELHKKSQVFKIQQQLMPTMPTAQVQ